MCAWFVISAFAATRVDAQEVATSFERLRSLLKPGDTIQVTDANGRKTTGKVLQLTASSLEIQIGKQRVPKPGLAERDVREIKLERHDSLLNGMLIGLAVGAGPGIFFIAGRSGGSDPIQDASTAIGLVVVPGALGAGIGALIDALIFKRPTVYRATSPKSSGVQVSPLASKSATGVQI